MTENLTSLIIFLPSFFLSSLHLKRVLYFLATFQSNKSSTLLLNLVLHIKCQSTIFELVFLELTKQYFNNFAQDLIIPSIFLLFTLVLVQKDLKNLDILSSLYSSAYQEKQQIVDSLEIPSVFIDESGKILKLNSKALNIFKLAKNENFYSSLTKDQVARLKEMTKVSKKQMIPEVDFHCTIPDHGRAYYILSVKSVPFNAENAFLLTFVNMTLSAKKRRMVMDSYSSNLFLQCKTQSKFIQKYVQGEKICLKDFFTLLKYIYSQQETICVTYLVTGESAVQTQDFDLKHEALNSIQFYWKLFKKKSVEISFSCKEYPAVKGDKVKYHLLFKSLIHYVSFVVSQGSVFEIALKKVTGTEVSYSFNFTAKDIEKKEICSILFASDEDVDDIYRKQNKFGLTVCLFPWLLKVLNGKIDKVSVKNSKVFIGFSLTFSQGFFFQSKGLCFFSADDGEVIRWPSSKAEFSRSSLSIFKLRRKTRLSNISELTS